MSTTTITTEMCQSDVNNCRPVFMTSCLVVTDLAALFIAGVMASLCKAVVSGAQTLPGYLAVMPLLVVLIVVYAGLGLYSGASHNSPEELRRSTTASVLILVISAALALFFPVLGTLFRSPLSLAVVFSMACVPIARAIVRRHLASSSWWGYPTVVFGSPQLSKDVFDRLLQESSLGLKPVACISPGDNVFRASEDIETALIEAQLSLCASRIRSSAYAVIVGAMWNQDQILATLQRHRKMFSHILIVPDKWAFSCVGVSPKTIGGMFGLEVRQQVFSPGKQIIKRALDIGFSTVLALLFSPLMLLIAVAIKFESAGPVFFFHRRIGRGGKEFSACKFRSMVEDADAVLWGYLAGRIDLLEEWESNHKLRSDPRITRLGRFLRRTSLDEFPQLWNVLRGDMSLVGPRPIVREEIARYGEGFQVYTQVRSGLTGLWQVSGRSDTSYQQRVNFDTFYVRNWSVWLDLCILFRTIGAVLSRSGAV